MSERDKARRKERYASMTDEQKQARRDYQAAFMRAKRAKLRAQKAPVKPAKTSKAQSTTSASKDVPAAAQPRERQSQPVHPPLKAQHLASYDSVSAQKGKNLQKAWTRESTNYLLECITSPSSPFSGAGLRATKSMILWFNLGSKVTQMTDREKMTDDYLFAVMLECLERLMGRQATGSPPALVLPAAR
jgi:hypothetical protein